MTDEEKKEKESEEDEGDEDFSDEERRNRWKKQWLRRVAEKATKKFEKGRRVDAGFQDAFGGQENAHKYYRHHDFKFVKERGDEIKVPESKSPGKPAMGFTEPSKWIPPKHTEEYPARKHATETLQIPEKPIDNHGRREAERTDGEGKDDIHKAQALVVDKGKDYSSDERIAAVEFEAPRSSVPDVASHITSRMKDAGYERVSPPTVAEYTFEPAFAEDDLEKMESAAREDSISPLELSDIHEGLRRKEIENVLETQRQEMLEGFEIQPVFHDDATGLTAASSDVADVIVEPEIAKPKPEVEDV